MGPQRARSELAAIAAWRKSLLERVLVLCFLLLSLALFVGLVRPQIMERRIFTVALVPGWLMVAAALWPKVSLRFRAIALTAGMLTVSIGSVAKLGLSSVNGFTTHLMLVVMVALFMSRGAAWIVWAIGLCSWWLIALYMPGAPLPGGDNLFDPSRLSNWARVIGIYAIISACTLSVVSYLAGRMESALRRSEALYAALTDESTRRIAALEEQRGLEEQLRQSQKMEALGTLAGGIAHDFNNLLVVIINHAELAGMQAVSEPVRESLAQIQAAGERAASLTQRLLTFGRRQVTERAVLDLNTRVEEALKLLHRLLPTSIELVYALDAQAPRVRASEIEIDQIIMNLCVNARDAMPGGGKLTLRSSNQQRRLPGGTEPVDMVCLEIVDSGTGMDETTRERMFEPFFTTKEKGHGTGLGLSTVHALVQSSGGFLEVDSSPGAGTTVRILLPSYSGEETAQSVPSLWPVRPGSETILIVDDDPQVRAILARRLRDNGYHVIVCQDGEEALREYRRRPQEIALVISDAVMPKLGARELHAALLAEFGEIPFLICSGYAAQTIESDFFDHPLRAFMQKPFDDHTLQSRVRALLDEDKKRKSEPAASFALTHVASKPLR